MRKTALFVCTLILSICSIYMGGCIDKEKANLTEYNIECTLDGYNLSATESVGFINNTDNVLTELKFNLFANAFRKDALFSPISAQYLSRAYPNGMSYGEISISKVDVDGKDAEFDICGQDKNILSVKLGKTIYPDERVNITIKFSVSLANVIARTGYNEKTINLANFYPILCVYENGEFYECVYYDKGDPFYSECANYQVKITCDSEYLVASSGAQIDKTKSGNTQTLTYKVDSARSFSFVLSKNFSVLTDKTTGTQINYYYYQDENPNQSLDYAVKAVKLFKSMFGAFPYKTYSVVQTKFVQGGMEFPALAMISDELSGLSYGEVIVHETAHQYWQSAVGNNEIEHAFLDEGLAEYSVVLFYENYSEYGYTRKNLIKASEQTYKVFCSVSDKLFGKVNTVMLRGLKDFSSEYEYVNIAYIKPCIMYDNLRTTIGDGRFFSGLKRYYNNYKYKNAKPDDMVGAFEKIGAGTNGFFQSFFDGKVII
ncbi:MAG: M1 family metallopeptidase [Clostridiales bacterium]|nr:M1 family metallopeptidase [Clostridiales bacterium]